MGELIVREVFNAGEKKRNIFIENDMFKIDKKTKEIHTIKQEKRYGFNYDKRAIVINENGNIDTLPFGY